MTDHSDDRIIKVWYCYEDGIWHVSKRWSDGALTSTREPDERHACAEAAHTARSWGAENLGRV